MFVRFRNRNLERCYLHHKQAVRTFGVEVARKYIGRINIIKQARNYDELRTLPALACHALKGDRAGQFAMKLTRFYRLVFTLEGEELEVVRIEEVTKHYGD